MDIFEKDREYIASTYARFPVEIVSGSGSLVRDSEGREYIDLSTGIAVNTFGVSDPVWQKAVTSQLAVLNHMSNLYYTEPCAKLAEQLCLRTGMKKVFFSNSGAEANECAIKVARKYSQDKYRKERFRIITLKNSFHGRTLTTLAATGQEVFHRDFTPLTEGFLCADAGDLDGIKEMCEGDTVAAVMIEVVQGEGGVVPLDPVFVTGLADFCASRDILLVCDEVQTGNGRTGELYGYMNYGIRPDIFSTAKGLAGGLPLGATVIGEKAAGVLTPGSHGSTFGGNPVCCAGAISVLERLDAGTLEGVRERSRMIRETLEGAKGVRGIYGLGLMLGVDVERDASAVIADCMKNGVLVIKAKNRVRLLPALNIPVDLLKKALCVLKRACAGA